MKHVIKKLLSEGLVSIEAENLLKWFTDHSNDTFVFFDTETTGLSRGTGNHVTQVGAIAAYFNPETLRFVEIDKFNKYIRLSDDIKDKLDAEKDLVIPDDPKELSKMFSTSKRAILKHNHYDIDKSASYDEELSVLAEFEDFLNEQGSLVLLAHNAPFDLSFVEVNQMFKDADREVFDTLKFFRSVFFPILTRISSSSERGQELLNKFGEKKSSGLENLVKGFSNPSELEAKLKMSHEAVQDCRNTMEVFEKGILAVYQHLSGK
jgi:DNA polymerase III epsilon subunit-like protein